MRKWLIIFVFAVIHKSSVSQGIEYIDSLVSIHKNTPSDSLRYDALSKLAIAYSDSAYNISLNYWEEALNLAKRKRNKQWMGDTYQQIGYILKRKGEFIEALEEYKNALAIFEQIENLRCAAEVNNDIGLIYKSWGKYEKALDYFFNALTVFEKINFYEGSAMAANNIGQIYYYREDYSRAIEYFTGYLKFNQKAKTYRAVAGAYNNIASAYMEMGDYNRALDNYIQSLKLYDSLKVKLGIAILYDNIGTLYAKQEQYDNALEYHYKALNLFNELNSKPRISYVKKNLGFAFYKKNDLPKAVHFFKESRNIAEELNQKEILKEIYFNLTNVYEELRRYQEALEAHRIYVDIRDSLQNIEIAEKLTTLEVHYESEKKSRELEILKTKYEQQKHIGLVVSIIGIIILLLSMLLARENIQKRKGLKAYRNHNDQMKDVMKSIKLDTETALYGLKKHFSEYLIMPKLIENNAQFSFITASKDELTVLLAINLNRNLESFYFFKLQCYGWLNEIIEITNELTPLLIIDYIKSKFKDSTTDKSSLNTNMEINVFIFKKPGESIIFAGESPFFQINKKHNSLKNLIQPSKEVVFEVKTDDVFFMLLQSVTYDQLENMKQKISVLFEKTLHQIANSSFDDQKSIMQSAVDFWISAYKLEGKMAVMVLKV